jgi:DNA ligase-1
MLLVPPSTACVAQTEPAPALQLANTYHAQADVSRYWVSEKYDGIRALWTGHSLITRAGHRIAAPAWFVEHWPATPLDGELWIARGAFERLSATVRDAEPDDAAWRDVKFMVFDLPAHGGIFDERLAALAAVPSSTGATLQRVQHWRVANDHELLAMLDRFVAAGAEGLMLHRNDSTYHSERSDDLLKLKPHHDDEAQVIGYVAGRGKYEGMMGALELRRTDGVEFNLGTGFTDEQRRHPPAIGDWVTYSYHGVTARGIPRFARFVRKRNE